jgi:hypothetical protein
VNPPVLSSVPVSVLHRSVARPVDGSILRSIEMGVQLVEGVVAVGKLGGGRLEGRVAGVAGKGVDMRSELVVFDRGRSERVGSGDRVWGEGIGMDEVCLGQVSCRSFGQGRITRRGKRTRPYLVDHAPGRSTNPSPRGPCFPSSSCVSTTARPRSWAETSSWTRTTRQRRFCWRARPPEIPCGLQSALGYGSFRAS